MPVGFRNPDVTLRPRSTHVRDRRDNSASGRRRGGCGHARRGFFAARAWRLKIKASLQSYVVAAPHVLVEDPYKPASTQISILSRRCIEVGRRCCSALLLYRWRDGSRRAGQARSLGIALAASHLHEDEPVRLTRTVGPRVQQRRLPGAGGRRDDRYRFKTMRSSVATRS